VALVIFRLMLLRDPIDFVPSMPNSSPLYPGQAHELARTCHCRRSFLHLPSCQISIPCVTDVLTREQRRRCMASIRGRDTGPEVVVRKLVHALGYPFRTHASDLPGKPDLVLRSRHKAVFVNGCFWHRHSCKVGRLFPETRAAFWRRKLLQNKARDTRNLRALRRLGWAVLVIWECELAKSPDRTVTRLAAFLST